LLLIDIEALAHSVFLVIITLYQSFACFIINAFALRRIVQHMIDAPRCRMYATATQPLDNFFVVNSNLYHVIDINADGNHGFCLRNRARKTIEQKSAGAVGSLDTIFDQTNNNVVRNQATGVHNFLCCKTKFGFRLYCRPQHVAGGDLRNAELLDKEPGLGALAGAGSAKKYQSHSGESSGSVGRLSHRTCR
jgi:hypothetical protein